MRHRAIFIHLFLFLVFVNGRSLKGLLLSRSLNNPQLPRRNNKMETLAVQTDEISAADDIADDENDISRAEENLSKHYFQGDIMTTDEQMGKIRRLLYSFSATADNQPTLRALIKSVERIWENGVVPYIIKEDVDDGRRKMVTDAIDHWESKTCLRFRKRKNEKDYVKFHKGDGCASYVGRMGGMQDVVIGNEAHSCKLGNIIHEIGHTIGFFHEQSRPDRDNFVKIKWDNIRKGYRVNFVRFSKSIIDSKGVAYDYGSIMHYPRRIFGKKRGYPTVVPFDHAAKIGQRIKLSDTDVLQARMLYNCNGTATANNNSLRI